MDLFFKILYFVIISGQLISQENFYALDKIQDIQINFGYDNWDYRLDTAKAGKENYILASSCLVNGVQFDSVGVKYKGYSSYRASNVKNPLHIKLDFIKNQDYEGTTSIKLGNNFSDPSAVREVLSYKILANYMDCSKANFARVYINGNWMGLYTNVEAVNKKFCEDHFGSSDHVFVKGNPDRPGNNSTSNLKFISYDSTKYYLYYGMENGSGWWKLIALMDTLRSRPLAIPNMVDIDRCLWMHAFNNVLSNYDSYTGAFSQNYYLYEDDNKRLLPVIWDMNMSFGSFPGGAGGTTLDKVPILYQSSNLDRPLISSLLANPVYKRMYLAHLKTIAEEYFASNLYETIAKELQATIDTIVKRDPNSLSNYSSFLTSLTAPVLGGGPGGLAPGIVTLMKARLDYYNTTAEYKAAPPALGNYTLFPEKPIINDTVWVQVSISNSNYAYLGYRKNKYAIFAKRDLFDDGNHHDGLANDGIFGSYFIVDTRKTQFYIYAENSTAGIFSPRRAEYEYHQLIAVPLTADIQPGELLLNEFMSSNKTIVKDPSDDKYEDWLELYNNTDRTLDLTGLNLTDDLTKLDKYEFPSGVSIQPKNRIIVWLDEDSSSPVGIHANFKISSTGELLILSRQDGLVLDSLSFSAIQTDYSMERCPDGIGKFKITSKPTFNLPNCGIVATENSSHLDSYEIVPNPAHDHFRIMVAGDVEIKSITVYNIMGQIVLQQQEKEFDISSLEAGFYNIVIMNLQNKAEAFQLLKL